MPVRKSGTVSKKLISSWTLATVRLETVFLIRKEASGPARPTMTLPQQHALAVHRLRELNLKLCGCPRAALRRRPRNDLPRDELLLSQLLRDGHLQNDVQCARGVSDHGPARVRAIGAECNYGIPRARRSGRLEDRAGGQRDAATTPGPHQSTATQAPGSVAAATWTDQSFGPPQPLQVVHAFFLAGMRRRHAEADPQ